MSKNQINERFSSNIEEIGKKERTKIEKIFNFLGIRKKTDLIHETESNIKNKLLSNIDKRTAIKVLEILTEFQETFCDRSIKIDENIFSNNSIRRYNNQKIKNNNETIIDDKLINIKKEFKQDLFLD